MTVKLARVDMRLVRCWEKIDLVFLQIYPVKELSFGLTCTPWYRFCGFWVLVFLDKI